MSDRTKNSIEAVVSVCKAMPAYPLFQSRLDEGGGFTRDENPESHFSVYFAAYDPKSRMVFMGHHKKSNHWLFNGGHIDAGETPEETLLREISEEWGDDVYFSVSLDAPSLITVTEINNTRQPCKRHYDIWYFIPTGIDSFHPDRSLLGQEFYETRWLKLQEAMSLTSDRATIEALEKLFASM